MIKLIQCLMLCLASIKSIYWDSILRVNSEKVMPEMNVIHKIKHIEDTMVIRQKRELATYECADDTKTMVADSIKCSKELINHYTER